MLPRVLTPNPQTVDHMANQMRHLFSGYLTEKTPALDIPSSGTGLTQSSLQTTPTRSPLEKIMPSLTAAILTELSRPSDPYNWQWLATLLGVTFNPFYAQTTPVPYPPNYYSTTRWS